MLQKLLADPIAIATVALVAIAAIQALIYIVMLRTTHRVERAYVYVDSIVDIQDFHAGSSPSFSFRVKNSGRTPARIIGYNAVYWPNRLPKKMPLHDSDLIEVGFSMVSNQDLPLTVGFETPIDAAQFDEVIGGQREAFIFGRVRYRDQFQWFRTRDANFTFQFEYRPLPTDAPGTTGFGFNIAPKAFNDSN